MFYGIKGQNKKGQGFTLIELIISVTIFAIIITALYSTFYMGLKAWRRGEEKNSLEKVRPALLKLEKDLENSFFFSGIQFKGTSTEISFPLSSPEGAVYTITYNVDEEKKELIRKEKKYPEVIGEENKEKVRKMIPSMKSIKFEYAYDTSGITKSFDWQENWETKGENKFPKGVMITFETEENQEIYSKVIFLPHGELGVK